MFWRRGRDKLDRLGSVKASASLRKVESNWESSRCRPLASAPCTHHPDSCAETAFRWSEVCFWTKCEGLWWWFSYCSVLNNGMCFKGWGQQLPGEGQALWPASSEPFAWCSGTQVSSRTQCTPALYTWSSPGKARELISRESSLLAHARTSKAV